MCVLCVRVHACLCVCEYMHACMCVCTCSCVGGGLHACLQGAGDCLHCHTLPCPTVSIHKEGRVGGTARLHREGSRGDGRGGEERKVKEGKE